LFVAKDQGRKKLKTAIVVGSGLTGLTAAYRLKQAGWQVTVLEKADRICGRVITFEKNGYIIDGCPTSCSTAYIDYIELLKEVGLGDKLTDASNIFGIVRNGKAYYVNGLTPVRSFLGTKFMSWPEKIRFVLGALKLKKYTGNAVLADPGNSVQHDHLSIDYVARDCFGDALIDTLMDPIMRVVTFGDVHSTTSVELFTGIISASGRYVNVLGGLETLPRELAKHVSVKLNSPAHKIEKRNGKVEVTYVDTVTGTSHTGIVDHCVIASDFPEAAKMCPQLAIEGPALARQTAFATSFVVHLGYTVQTKTNPAAVALPRVEFPNNPAFFLDHNKASDRAPKGHSLFTLYYCPEAVEMVKSWPEEKVISDACSIIERYFPEVKGHLDMTNIKFAPYGSHLAPPGHFKAVREFFANHSATDPIQVGGDYLSLPSQETAVGQGNRAARRIIQNHR
jgi:protoporphyrinogen/coproporphyrinogen III oxidase